VNAERIRRKFAMVEAIALASGHGVSASEIIRRIPAALCYSDDRLAARREIAKDAACSIGIANLFSLSDAARPAHAQTVTAVAKSN
jgi:chromosome segregation and condensation protein ScpB